MELIGQRWRSAARRVCRVTRARRASRGAVARAQARGPIAARRPALYGVGCCRACTGLLQPPASCLGPVAQWLEPTAHNGLVGGSSPPGPTIFRWAWRQSARLPGGNDVWRQPSTRLRDAAGHSCSGHASLRHERAHTRVEPAWGLGSLGIEPRHVLVHRNPLALMKSLQGRDGMTPGFAALVWLRHVLDVELPRATRRGWWSRMKISSIIRLRSCAGSARRWTSPGPIKLKAPPPRLSLLFGKTCNTRNRRPPRRLPESRTGYRRFRTRWRPWRNLALAHYRRSIASERISNVVSMSSPRWRKL
jgi:hypothetical protein